MNYWPYLHIYTIYILHLFKSVLLLDQLLDWANCLYCGAPLLDAVTCIYFFVESVFYRSYSFPFFHLPPAALIKNVNALESFCAVNKYFYLRITSFDFFSEHADLLNSPSLKECDWKAGPVVDCIMSCSRSKSGANCMQIVSANWIKAMVQICPALSCMDLALATHTPFIMGAT